MHHHIFHVLELVVILFATITSGGFMFANLTGLNEGLYRENSTEVAQQLLNAMQNPTASLKLGNIISIRTMDMDVENSFAKGYCTYGAARISPEFFPFIDVVGYEKGKIQQRTWGGNAVDRCKNASDTGYKIGTVPSQGALIVYNAGGRFGAYGHVGKVLHYEKSLKKIIVRDMARVANGTISDRWEDLTTANVKCYIYNSKTNVPDIDPIIIPSVNTGTQIVTGSITPTIPVVMPTTPIIPVITPTPTPVHTSPTLPPTTPVVIPTQPVITPTQPIVVTPVETTTISTPIITPTVPVDSLQTSVNKKISFTLEHLSDIAEHFITQNNLVITLVAKSPLKPGETAILTLEIKDKNGDPFSGLLPFSFTLLSTNDSLQPSIANIQLINNGSVDVSIVGQKIGIATIVINMDDTRIGEFSLEVK